MAFSIIVQIVRFTKYIDAFQLKQLYATNENTLYDVARAAKLN